MHIDLVDAEGTFEAKWFDPRTGQLHRADGGTAAGGQIVEFDAPDADDWALWLTKGANP